MALTWTCYWPQSVDSTGAETTHNRLSLDFFLHPSPKGFLARPGIAHWTRGKSWNDRDTCWSCDAQCPIQVSCESHRAGSRPSCLWACVTGCRAVHNPSAHELVHSAAIGKLLLDFQLQEPAKEKLKKKKRICNEWPSGLKRTAWEAVNIEASGIDVLEQNRDISVISCPSVNIEKLWRESILWSKASPGFGTCSGAHCPRQCYMGSQLLHSLPKADG